MQKLLSCMFFFMLTAAMVDLRSAVCAAEPAPTYKAHRPNIVFILADDRGYGDVRCNKSAGLTPAPAIDQLAKEGVRFTDAQARFIVPLTDLD